MSICLMFGAVVWGAEQQDGLSPSEVRPKTESRQLALELRDSDISPEERVIRIEQWRHEKETLVRIIRAERAARLAASAKPLDSRPTNHPASPAAPVPSDPVLADIHEIEKEVRDFQKSLRSRHLAPEQRAIQIERFQLLNKETFRQLHDLKKEAVAHAPAAEDTTAVEPANIAPLSGKKTRLKEELDRIQHDLSQADPEARARYLETHAATLQEMGKKQWESEITGESASNSTPSTPNPDQP